MPIARQEELAILAEQLIEVHSALLGSLFNVDRRMLEQRVEILEARVDAQVYALYGPTAEEVALVEGSKGEGEEEKS